MEWLAGFGEFLISVILSTAGAISIMAWILWFIFGNLNLKVNPTPKKPTLLKENLIAALIFVPLISVGLLIYYF